MDKVLSIIGTVLLVLLFIILFLLLLLIVVCISHPKIVIKYKEKAEISVSLWLIKFNILKFLFRQKKNKKIKIIKFDGKSFGEFPPAKKKEKKKKASDKNKKVKKAHSAAEKDKKPLTETVSDMLELVSNILFDIKEPLKKVLKADIKKLHITAASEDPHKTAVLFGNMNTAAGTLILICRKFASLDIDEENVGVYSDFCASKPSLDMHIVLTLSARHIIICGFKAAMKYIRNKE